MAQLSREHYHTDAAVVWCFDARFKPALQELSEKLNLKNIDVISVAGGAKNLSSPEKPEYRNFILQQIDASVRLHGAKRVILMTHSDCGAYGGLAAFGGKEDAEFQKHEKELQSAKTLAEARFPDLKTEAYFCNFSDCLAI